MSLTDDQQTAERHPWLDVFIGSPVTALSDLLAGHAHISPYERADAPDAALWLFKSLGRDDPARQALSAAILTWIEERRTRPFAAARPKLQREIREVCEAFEIVALLDLPEAALALRRGFIRWNDWVDRLVLSEPRDARAAYWRMLALTQPIAFQSAPNISAYDLMPMWQEVCRQAGGLLPRHYLSIGLLGLRRLPNSERELQWLSGLAQWALARGPSDAEFKAEWFGLKQLYPRAPDHWRKAVDKLLSAPTFVGVAAPAWWHVDPDFAPMAKPNFRRTGTPLRSPMPEEAWEIVDRLDAESYSAVLPAIESAAARHRLFVESTGDSQYFVRFIHSVGTALIEGGVRSPRTARAAQALAREGLKWDPKDSYLLSLWQNALAAEGRFETAELVGWESIRRNPDISAARTELAALLVERGRYDEAVSLLNQAIARFPENPIPRDQLALVLAERLGRPEEAEAILREAICLFPENAASRNQLALVLAERLGRPEEAEAVLREAISLFPESAYSRTQLATVLAERLRRPEEAEAVLREAVRLFPKNVIARNQLAAVLANSGRPDEAAVLHEEQEFRRNEAPPPEDGSAKAAGKAVRPAENDGPVVAGDLEGLSFGGEPTNAANQPATLKDQHAFMEGSSPGVSDEDYELENVLRLGYLRRLRFRLETATGEGFELSLRDLRKALEEESGLTYAEIVAMRHGVLARNVDALPAIAAAFEEALTEEDRDLLEHLARRRPRLRGLVLVARALFGDDDAQREIERLLTEPDIPKWHDVSQSVRTTLGPVLGLIRGGQPLASALAERRGAVLLAVYDANEAMLGGLPIAA